MKNSSNWLIGCMFVVLAGIVIILATLPLDADASDDFVVYDLGNGTYIAGATGMEEWILWIYYQWNEWFGPCEPNY